MPVRGHCSSAVTSASCASSSASPTSRSMRVSPAMRRADSMRHTASMVRWASVACMTADDTIAEGAAQATARPSVFAERQNVASGRTAAVGSGQRLDRLGTVDHPGNAEAIGAHAEALRPEGFLEGHGHGAVLGQRPENALGVRRLIHCRHDVETLRRLVAIRRCVTTQQELLAEVEPRMDDLLAHLRRSLLCAGGLAIGHREPDPAAENLGVEAEGFAAVALEMQVCTGIHDAELRNSGSWLRRMACPGIDTAHDILGRGLSS